MLVQINTDSDTYFGSLDQWLNANMEASEAAEVRAIVERDGRFEDVDETHGIFLKITTLEG